MSAERTVNDERRGIHSRGADDAWSDGLTHEVITQIGAVAPAQLGVVAPTTALCYRRTRKKPDDLGRELAVDYLLQSSVKRTGARVRLTVSLISVADQSALWSTTFDRESREVPYLPSEVAVAVARRIRLETPRLAAWSAEPRRRPGLPGAPDAYDLFLRARGLAGRGDRDSVMEALGLLKQALAADPQNAGAHAATANLYVMLATSEGPRPRDTVAQARRAAQAALSLDDGLAEAHGALAYVRLRQDQDWAGAEREYRRALALNPSDATTHERFASHYLRARGRMDEAIAEVRRALVIDPLAVRPGVALADILVEADRPKEALEQCQRALARDPTSVDALLVEAEAYEDMGAFDQALASLEKAGRLAPKSAVAFVEAARIQALSGRTEEARRTLGRGGVTSLRYVEPFRRARLHVALGEKDEALQVLEAAAAEKALGLDRLSRDPRFDPLRADPRFQRLAKRTAPPA